jgi:hypothetical protein
MTMAAERMKSEESSLLWEITIIKL